MEFFDRTDTLKKEHCHKLCPLEVLGIGFIELRGIEVIDTNSAFHLLLNDEELAIKYLKQNE
jgi:hypothetical protein